MECGIVGVMAQQGGVSAKKYNRQGLTPKQAKFVQGIAKGKPAYKAAMDAYDTNDPVIANNIAVENRQKPSIRNAIDAAMVKLNLTPERALMPIDRALRSDSISMQLQGTDRWIRLLPKEDTGGNTINFNFGSDASLADKA